MVWLVQTVQGATTLPCCIDSPNPESLKAGLQVHRGQALVNSASAEAGRIDTVIPLAAEHKARLVALTLDDAGLPTTAQQRTGIAVRLGAAAAAAGIPQSDLFIDPAGALGGGRGRPGARVPGGGGGYTESASRGSRHLWVEQHFLSDARPPASEPHLCGDGDGAGDGRGDPRSVGQTDHGGGMRGGDVVRSGRDVSRVHSGLSGRPTRRIGNCVADRAFRVVGALLRAVRRRRRGRLYQAGQGRA